MDPDMPKKKKRKWRKPSVVKRTVKRGSAIIRNFQAGFYEQLEAGTLKADPGLTDLKLPLWQQLSVKMLMHGHPKAFVEFFELSHQPLPPPPSPDYVDPATLIGLKTLNDAEETLHPLQTHLEAAEMGDRKGDYEKMFQAYLAIGLLFENILDYDQSLFYLLRCLTAAENTRNQAHIAEVKFNLGRVYWKLLDSAQAIERYEQYITLARAAGDSGGIIQAAENLLQIHRTCGEEAEKVGELQKSVECYERAVKSAETGNNLVAAGDARHQLGLLHSRLNHPKIALDYQNQYLKFCQSVSDKVGEGKAHAAMAQVYEATNYIENSIKHTESYLKVAKDTDLTTQAKASCKLGMLYHRHDNLRLADKYFQQYFAMARELKDVRMMAVARVNIGIVQSALNIAEEEVMGDIAEESDEELIDEITAKIAEEELINEISPAVDPPEN